MLRPYRLCALVGLAACAGRGAPERVIVPPGATLRVAAESLYAHGIIRSTTWFRLRARLARADRNVKAGVYQFARGAGTGAALQALRAGDVLQFRVTVPTGGTIYDLARSASEKLGIAPDSLLAAARDTAFLHQLGISAPSAEGWLLPESFDFGGLDTPRDVITRFVLARKHQWHAGWDTLASAAGLSREQVLTLASIVEGEAKDSSEMPLIAAVYRNRLQQQMPLQADPTIEYAYLLRTGERHGRLYNVDYQLESPWNTYRYPGLPPGPVGNPSTAAISAVLNPAPVPYLYFVAGPNGKSIFATSYAQHLRNIQQARRDP